MFKLVLTLLMFLFVGACQLAPTKIKTEVSGKAENILADTRSALEFSTYHISGSVHLRSEDFLIIKDPKSKSRAMDPDIEQLVERLASRGLEPSKDIQLICDDKDLTECGKWQWLLTKLGFLKIEPIKLSEYIKQNRPLRNRPNPDRVGIWPAQNRDHILKNASTCFVSFQDSCIAK